MNKEYHPVRLLASLVICLAALVSSSDATAIDRCGSWNSSTLEARSSGIERPVWSNRISGGYPAPPGAFPAYVAIKITYTETQRIRRKYVRYCGGAIIDKNLVLTAARCFNFQDPSPDVLVRTSTDGFRYEFSPESPDTYIGKKLCADKDRENDFAVLSLKGRRIRFSSDVKPALLPEQAIRVREQAYVVGAGYEDEHKRYPRAAKVLPVASVSCEGKKANSDLHICLRANHRQYPGALCQGDLGAPVFVTINKKQYLYGINSSKPQKCVPKGNKVGVFLSTHYREDHIRDLMDRCTRVLNYGEHEKQDDYDEDHPDKGHGHFEEPEFELVEPKGDEVLNSYHVEHEDHSER